MLDASKVPFGTKTAITPLDAGTYPGRLVQVIDIGVQPQQYMGEEKEPARCILTTYELVDEFLKDEEGNDIEDKPRWLSEQMPLFSLRSEKARSTKRYLALDPANVHGGNWLNVVGAPVLVSVIQNPGKDNRIWNKIVGTSPMREKDAKKLAPLVNPPVVFDLDEPDMEVFNGLHDWIKNLITSSIGCPLQGVAATKVDDNRQPPLDIDDEEAPF